MMLFTNGSGCLYLNGDFGKSPFLGQLSAKQIALPRGDGTMLFSD